MQKIAVGSQNPVKVEAVQRVVQRVWPDSEVVAYDVLSGVRAQPLSAEEAIAGARTRAQTARQLGQAHLGFGLEGAVEDTPWGMFLVNWVVIVDEHGQEGLGSGGRLLLPDRVAQAVRRGRELGPVMDEITSMVDSKKGPGAVGILTAGLLPRALAFEIGIINALAPFLSPQFYPK